MSTATFCFSAAQIAVDVTPVGYYSPGLPSFPWFKLEVAGGPWPRRLVPSFQGQHFSSGKIFVMRFDGLNYFLTKNVFALEEGGESAVMIDTKTGLLTPHDAMLVGHLMDR